MTRPYFESPDYFDPDRTETEEFRRQRVPAWKILLGGMVIAAMTLGGVTIQRAVGGDRSGVVVEAVREQAAREGKFVLMVLASSEAAASIKMDRETWTDDDVRDLVDRRFRLCRLNANEPAHRDLAATYGMRKAPTIVLTNAAGDEMVDAEGRPLRRVGYVAPEQLRAFLESASIVEPSKTQRPVLRMEREHGDRRSTSN